MGHQDGPNPGHPLRGHTLHVTSIAFSPDGLTLASGSQDKMGLWDTRTGQAKASLFGGGSSVAFAPDGLTLASGSEGVDAQGRPAPGAEVRLWDVKTGQAKAILSGHRRDVTSVAFSHDGLMLASASEDNTVRLWDVKTRQPKATLFGRTAWLSVVAFSADGKRVFGWDGMDKVLAWTTADGQPTDPANPPRYRNATVATSPDGSLRAEAHGTGIALIELADYDPQRELAERRLLDAVNVPFFHRQQANRAEQDQDWFAAAFHFGQLLKDKPDDPDLLRRRDAARKNLKAAEVPPMDRVP